MIAGPSNAPLVIGLGGNIGAEPTIIERFGRARAALGALAEPGRVRSAPLFRSAPIGPAQAPYLNTALRLEVPDLQPDELIATLLELERLLGRRRDTEERWGPRAIDLDVLVWGGRTVATTALEVPHPRLADRRFALAPLVALLGEEFDVPGLGPAGALLAQVVDQDCEELAAGW